VHLCSGSTLFESPPAYQLFRLCIEILSSPQPNAGKMASN
jgi:hypothetical protein